MSVLSSFLASSFANVKRLTKQHPNQNKIPKVGISILKKIRIQAKIVKSNTLFLLHVMVLDLINFRSRLKQTNLPHEVQDHINTAAVSNQFSSISLYIAEVKLYNQSLVTFIKEMHEKQTQRKGRGPLSFRSITYCWYN